MKAGIIADDFTGATDIASFLANHGIETRLFSGVPDEDDTSEATALVISLKSRAVTATEAISLSLDALQWLQRQQCDRFFFKYCSTFDSTAQGNIGPVTDALMAALDLRVTVVSPALPVNGRTVYQGYLFVEDRLLQDSGMRNHPVNPMEDSDLRRLMEQQSEGKCALINAQFLDANAAQLTQRIEELSAAGYQYVVIDALNDTHLELQGRALRDMKLVTGGSGLAAGLAKAWAHDAVRTTPFTAVPDASNTVILSGSCSVKTQEQVANYIKIAPSMAIDVAGLLENEWDLADYVSKIIDWLQTLPQATCAPLIYATTSVAELKNIQARYGAEASRLLIENLFAMLARRLVTSGIEYFIVAGGETSGAVTEALRIQRFTIGKAVSPGVPWIKADDRQLYLLLKSGNFGDLAFFSRAQKSEVTQ
ncbi:3-oxo-tetronate kinase [Scandinavium manionii]|uniref:3-oxo-tetronate kinase n=1 Tax=Scandinavium manionii TaxID=2926520 RepID=UPI00135979D7|nr:3-oxo-tetronate kinase [Scandinavium manionii]MCS2149974.1 four-carbon acid sugar kinase family protein [Scandinavium manionii]MCS2168338.1 four-carbon acid sugar kinase family protein [Scandinavium manionii]